MSRRYSKLCNCGRGITKIDTELCNKCRTKAGNVCSKCGKLQHYSTRLCASCSEMLSANRKVQARRRDARKGGYIPLSLSWQVLKETLSKTLETQNNCCAVCKSSFDEKKYVIDHNHSTGEFRGLLCNNCNLLEGFARTPEICEAMARYLRNNQ